MADVSERGKAAGTERRVFAAQLEVRAKADGSGGTRYELEGYASAYDSPYRMYDMFGEYEEVVRAGAGAKTLSENPDVTLVFNHTGLPIARTKAGNLELSEDDHGLHMRAPSLNGDISLVRDIVTSIQDGVLDEMSFAFRVTKQEWSPDWAQRDITEYNLHRGDVSVVTYGANPATSVALRAEDLGRVIDHLEGDALREAHARLSARLSGEDTQTQRRPVSLRAAEDDELISRSPAVLLG